MRKSAYKSSFDAYRVLKRKAEPQKVVPPELHGMSMKSMAVQDSLRYNPTTAKAMMFKRLKEANNYKITG